VVSPFRHHEERQRRGDLTLGIATGATHPRNDECVGIAAGARRPRNDGNGQAVATRERSDRGGLAPPRHREARRAVAME